MEKLIAIVFPNWNGKDNTIKLLESLNNIDYDKSLLQIICIDNGSTDGSQAAIKNYMDNRMTGSWKKMKVIELDSNKGATVAYNQGFSEAIAEGCDYVWKLDNDVYVERKSLKNLLNKFIKVKDIGIVGSVVYPLFSYESFDDNYEGVAEIGCKIIPLFTSIYKKTLSYDQLLNIESDLYYDIDYSIGCSNLIKKEVFEKVGLLDEDFFLYYDDTYFSYLARERGFVMATSLDSVVFHKGSASTGGVMKPLGIYYTTLSELIFFKKIFLKKFIVFFPSIFVKRFLLTFVRLLKAKNFKVLAKGIEMFLKANKDFFKRDIR